MQDDEDNGEDFGNEDNGPWSGDAWSTNPSEELGSRPTSWFGSDSVVSEDSSLPPLTGSESFPAGACESGARGAASVSDPSAHAHSDWSGSGPSSSGGSDIDIPSLIPILEDGYGRHVRHSWEDFSGSSNGSLSGPPSLHSLCSDSERAESTRRGLFSADLGDGESSSGPPSLWSMASDTDCDLPCLLPLSEERLVPASDNAGIASASLRPRSTLPVTNEGHQGISPLTDGTDQSPMPDLLAVDSTSRLHSIPSDCSLPSLVSEEDNSPCWQELDDDQVCLPPLLQSSSCAGDDTPAVKDGMASWTAPSAAGVTESIIRRGPF